MFIMNELNNERPIDDIIKALIEAKDEYGHTKVKLTYKHIGYQEYVEMVTQ
jgi:hypothetical protein